MEAPAHQKCEDSGGNTLLRTIQLSSATCPPKVRQYTAGIPSGKKHSQPRTGPSATTLGGDDSEFIGETTVFDRYFSLPAALVRHKSAPLLRQRERFLAHLEATGTRWSAIRIAATYLLQVVNILGLRSLREVTIEEVDRAADHWNTVRNQDKQYPAGQFGVRCFAQTARRFLRFEGKLQYPRLPQPFSKYLEEFVEAMSTERGLSEATIRGRRYRAADFLQMVREATSRTSRDSTDGHRRLGRAHRLTRSCGVFEPGSQAVHDPLGRVRMEANKAAQLSGNRPVSTAAHSFRLFWFSALDG
jgi:hypothetical protein